MRLAAVNHHSRCTAQRANGAFCDAPSVPDAPFPICVKHLAEAARFLNSLIPDQIAGVRAAAVEAGDLPERRTVEPYREVVYYVMVGGLVKIGTTSRLGQRLSSYPPHGRLLATEPGGTQLEARRHLQFRDSLAAGREWFRPTAELFEHINSLRDEPLTAAELAV